MPLQSVTAQATADSGLAADSLRRMTVADSIEFAAMLARDDSLMARGGLAMGGPPSAASVWLVLAVLATVIVGFVALLAWIVGRVRRSRREP